MFGIFSQNEEEKKEQIKTLNQQEEELEALNQRHMKLLDIKEKQQQQIESMQEDLKDVLEEKENLRTSIQDLANLIEQYLTQKKDALQNLEVNLQKEDNLKSEHEKNEQLTTESEEKIKESTQEQAKQSKLKDESLKTIRDTNKKLEYFERQTIHRDIREWAETVKSVSSTVLQIAGAVTAIFNPIGAAIITAGNVLSDSERSVKMQSLVEQQIDLQTLKENAQQVLEEAEKVLSIEKEEEEKQKKVNKESGMKAAEQKKNLERLREEIMKGRTAVIDCEQKMSSCIDLKFKNQGYLNRLDKTSRKLDNSTKELIKLQNNQTDNEIREQISNKQNSINNLKQSIQQSKPKPKPIIV